LNRKARVSDPDFHGGDLPVAPIGHRRYDAASGETALASGAADLAMEVAEEGAKAVKAGDWLRNTRGEWFVVAQVALMLAVLGAPKLDARSVSWSALTAAAGVLLCSIGLGFVVLGSMALGRNLSPFPKPIEGGTLVENGPFSVVRHPIYGGFSLAAFGWSLVWSSIATLTFALLLLIVFDLKARREERWLEEKFPGYAAYKSRVKKLIPFVY
jgi:protein-S-isoprenylcysteine O-methyltransferase Ste14